MRSTLLTLLVAMPMVGIANAAIFGSRLRRFAREVPRLQSSHDLERFKAVVAEQMYAALAQIVILASPIVVFGYGIVRRILSPGDLAFVIVPSAAVLLAGLAYRSVEAQVKSMPAADEELTRARDAIVHVWLTRPFPNW